MAANNDEKKLARIAHKTDVTKRISETSRFVGFGVLAWVFALHSSESKFSKDLIDSYRWYIDMAGFAGILTIAADYLQYLFAYYSVRHTLKQENYDYNNRYWAYKGQVFCFWLKQITATLAALIVAGTFGLYVFFP